MKNLFRRIGIGNEGTTGRELYYVTGSGPVPIPARRVNEIQKLIAEHHDREAQLARVLASVRRA